MSRLEHSGNEILDANNIIRWLPVEDISFGPNVTYTESHDVEQSIVPGRVNKYVFRRDDGDRLLCINAWGGRGFMEGRWEVFASSEMDERFSNPYYEEGNLTSLQCVERICTFVNKESVFNGGHNG